MGFDLIRLHFPFGMLVSRSHLESSRILWSGSIISDFRDLGHRWEINRIEASNCIGFYICMICRWNEYKCYCLIGLSFEHAHMKLNAYRVRLKPLITMLICMMYYMCREL